MISETDPIPVKLPTLLLVDDEEQVRVALSLLFQGTYRILQAQNSAEAMHHITTDEVDLAILDIKMANESGLDLLKAIKAINPMIEAIMLTGYATMEYMQAAWDDAAFGFAQKPFDIAQLTAMLARAYRVRQQSKAMTAALATKDANSELYHIQNGVIHDINNMLTVAGGFVNLLQFQSDKTTLAPAELKSQLARIEDKIHLCGKISHRYFNTIRMSGGNAPNLHDMLTNLMGLLGVHPTARQAIFVPQFTADTMPQVEFREVHLFQTLLNLCINAAQSTDVAHTVTVSTQVVRDPLDMTQFQDTDTSRKIGSTFVNGPVVAVTIRDTGKGIAPHVLNQLFSSQYFTTKATGTGIGLSYVNTLLRDNKALLTVKTAVGIGTEVTLHLPLAPTQARA